MKKDEKPDTLAVIDDYNFHDRHTCIQTWRLYDRPGPEGRVGENVAFKILIFIRFEIECRFSGIFK